MIILNDSDDQVSHWSILAEGPNKNVSIKITTGVSYCLTEIYP